jgi:hypothetical protein
MKKINYVSTHKTFGDDTISSHSSLNIPGVHYELESLYDFVDSSNSFVECPVWSHKAKRSFLVRSPIDVEFRFESSDDDFYLVYPDSNEISGDSMVFLSDSRNKTWKGDGRPTVQLSFPTYVFWTKEKNIWIEVSPYPLTAVNNNYVSVGGWWNLSNWIRPTSFGMQIVDVNKPVKIKRGDVIYQVSFHSKNLNDSYKLINSDSIPENVMKKINQNVSLKHVIHNLSAKFLFTQQKESKCPFAFLFNK